MNHQLNHLRRLFGYTDKSFSGSRVGIVEAYYLSRGQDGKVVTRKNNGTYNPEESTIDVLDAQSIAVGEFNINLQFVQVGVQKAVYQIADIKHIGNTVGLELTELVTRKSGKTGKEFKVLDLNDLGKKFFRKDRIGTGSNVKFGFSWKLSADLFSQPEFQPITGSILRAITENGWYILPSHSSWVFDGKRDRILVPVSRTPIDPRLSANLQRAGKDIYGQPIGDVLRNQLILVTPATGTTEEDGNFWLNPRFYLKGRLALFRGVVKANGETGVIKGRGITTMDFHARVANAATSLGLDIPRCAVRAIISADNIKWGDLTPGFYTADRLYESKEEEHNDNGIHKMNPLFGLLGTGDDRIRNWIAKRTLVNIKRSYSNLKDADSFFQNAYEDILENETAGARMAGKVVKYFAGIASDREVAEISTTALRRGLSRSVRGVRYLAIIFADQVGGIEVTPEMPVLSRAAARACGLKSGQTKDSLMVRNPIVSRQNFIRVTLNGDKVSPLFGKNLEVVVLHPSLAVYCQGDGDDHALFYLGSPFTEMGIKADELITQEPINPSPEEDKATRHNALSLSILGATNQSRIGTVFNNMVLAVSESIRGGGSIDDVNKICRRLGSQLHIFAQGVKKPVKVITPAEMLELEEHAPSLEDVLERRDLVSLVSFLQARKVFVASEVMDMATERWNLGKRVECGFTHTVKGAWTKSMDVENAALAVMGIPHKGFRRALADEDLDTAKFLKALELYLCAHVQGKVSSPNAEPRAIAVAVMDELRLVRPEHKQLMVLA